MAAFQVPARRVVSSVLVRYEDGGTEEIDSHRWGRVERIRNIDNTTKEPVERVDVVLIRDLDVDLARREIAEALEAQALAEQSLHDDFSYVPDPPTPPGVHPT